MLTTFTLHVKNVQHGMRHLYCSTTLLQEFARECMRESVVLCCYCKGYKFWARSILKEIIEKIIRKHKQKVEYPIPQEFLELTKHETVVEYQTGEEIVMLKAVPTAPEIHPTLATQHQRYDVAASFELQMDTPQIQCEVTSDLTPVKFRCGYCNCYHYHGNVPKHSPLKGHRVAHCHSGPNPYPNGYYLRTVSRFFCGVGCFLPT